ncbi:MAG: hypothetical protein FJZ58_01185 [Chlamydiae bacterium]|nr:hypothetical protein [Chlamydiota bacterium]
MAFRVPKQTLAGRYALQFVVEGREHPDLRGEMTFFVQVLQLNELQASLNPTSNVLLAGESLSLQLQVHNAGNAHSTISLHLDHTSELAVFLEDQMPLLLDPGASKTVTLQIKASNTLTSSRQTFLSLRLQDISHDTPPIFLTAEFELFPQTLSTRNRYTTIPMQTTLGYGMKNRAIQGFIEQSGGGKLGKNHHIDFLLRLPFIQQANIDRDLGGSLENGYLHFWNSTLDIYGGDGIYTQTPLLLLNRFGRGGSLSLSKDAFLFKGICIQDTSSVPQFCFTGKLSYKPLPALTLSLSSLQTYFTSQSEKILQTTSSTTSTTLLGEVRNAHYGNHTLEYGNTSSFIKKQHQAGYFYSFATFPNQFWYTLQKIYAGPNFTGYYQNTDQLYMSIGFPILKRLQGSLSWNTSKYNLQKNPKLETAPRIHNGYSGLSYLFPLGLYLSTYYNYLHAKDVLSSQQYQTHFASVNLGKSWKQWTCQGILEQGIYTQTVQRMGHQFWQNYQLYLYYQPKTYLQYALYTKLGYIALAQVISWAKVYGISTNFLLHKQWSMQALYEVSTSPGIRHYISATSMYTFPRGSSLKLQAYNNTSNFQGNTLEFLLSYTIPWNLPVGKNKSSGTVQGKAYRKENTSPYSHLIVHCNDMRTLTDAQGRFTFSEIKPGHHHFWIEDKDPHLVPLVAMPLALHIQGGETTQVQIPFDHPCQIEGSILHEDIEQQGLAGAEITVIQMTSGKKIIVMTDSRGYFSLDKLMPGRLLIQVRAEQEGTLYHLDPKEQLLDLFPGEKRSIEIKLSPIKRPLHMIDTGTLHTQ